MSKTFESQPIEEVTPAESAEQPAEVVVRGQDGSMEPGWKVMGNTDREVIIGNTNEKGGLRQRYIPKEQFDEWQEQTEKQGADNQDAARAKERPEEEARLHPFTLDLRDKAKELGLVEQVDSYNTGDIVYAVRSPHGDEKNGKSESDWTFVGYDQKSGEVRIEKTEGNDRISKKVPLEAFRADQQSGAASQREQLESLRNEILSSESENSKMTEGEFIAEIGSAQSIEQVKALLENSGQALAGADAKNIAASIGELEELFENHLSGKKEMSNEEWSKRWNESFDQESGGYSGSKEMIAIKGKLNELFTKKGAVEEYKRKNSLGGRFNRFFGRSK